MNSAPFDRLRVNGVTLALPFTDRISGTNRQGGPLYVPKQQPLPLS